jgi:hypothetical protein
MEIRVTSCDFVGRLLHSGEKRFRETTRNKTNEAQVKVEFLTQPRSRVGRHRNSKSSALSQTRSLEYVLTFTPIQNRDLFLAKFLDTRVSAFNPKKGSNKLQLRNAITELPEPSKKSQTKPVRGYSAIRKFGRFSSGMIHQVDEPTSVISDPGLPEKGRTHV